MTQPSKLPWAVLADSADRCVVKSVANPDKPVSVIVADSWVNPADLALIVESVNSHAALVERVAKLEAALQGLVNAASDRGQKPNRHGYVTSGLGPYFEAAVDALKP